jgi:hypothetical protein
LKYTTRLEIHAKLTQVLVREIDEAIHAYLVATGEWSWDESSLVSIQYGSSQRLISEPGYSEKLAGVLVHDLDTFRLTVGGVEQNDFPGQIRCDTKIVMDDIEYSDYDYCMVEVTECPVIYQFESLGGYKPSELTFEVNRVVVANGLQCEFFYPYYEEECFYPIPPDFGPVLRSYVVDPWGKRSIINRLIA